MLQQVHEAGQPGSWGHQAGYCLQVPAAKLMEKGGLRKVLQQVLDHWATQVGIGLGLQAGVQACEGISDVGQSR